MKLRNRLSIRRFAQDRRALAGVEFALTAPILAILMVGAVDVGTLVYNRMDTTSSIQSGAQYFMSGGTDTNAAISVVKRSWTSMPQNATVNASRLCYCAEVLHACTQNCPDQSLPIAYNMISATLRYDGILIDSEYVISESVRVR